MSEFPRAVKSSHRRTWPARRIVPALATFAVGALPLLFMLAFLHPFGNARVADPTKQLMRSAQIDKQVWNVMQRSCQNCHSEQTAWPLYSHMAPISWLIEKDVQDGRGHWNMSRWDQYSIDQREDILSRIGPMVRNRQMPLPQYLLLHPEAKLSEADVEALYRWSKQERRRLRAEQATTDAAVK